MKVPVVGGNRIAPRLQVAVALNKGAGMTAVFVMIATAASMLLMVAARRRAGIVRLYKSGAGAVARRRRPS
jgi:hypothetical protein